MQEEKSEKGSPRQEGANREVSKMIIRQTEFKPDATNFTTDHIEFE